MTVAIAATTGPEAYDLIYPSYLSKMDLENQEIMRTAINNSSQVWIGTNDSAVVCMWGLVVPTFLSDRAYLWLFHTEHLQEYQFVFIRHSQRAVEAMLREYPYIVGHVVAGADKSIRWLRWLGAKFGEPQGKLIPFEIKAKHG